MRITLLLFVLLSGALRAQTTLSGTITSAASGLAIENAIVKVKNSPAVSIADSAGVFSLFIQKLPCTLSISCVGYLPLELEVQSPDRLRINLTPDDNQLEEVYISTGYQNISNQKTTGSFAHIDNALYNRSAGMSVLARLEGVTNGLNFDRRNIGGIYSERNTPMLQLRGVNTIEGNQSPLLIVDNFPYDGNIENLNPNDIESVTVLKDAAAASIWGAQAANGVIVITTRKGGDSPAPKVSLRSTFTIENKPDLYYSPDFIRSRDFLALELNWFNNNRYTESEYQVLSPFVDALFTMKKQDGALEPTKVQSLMNDFTQYDIRESASAYLYRRAFIQQHSLSISGGTDKVQYYVAGGFDKGQLSLRGNDTKRTSFTTNLTYRLSSRLSLNSQLGFIQAGQTENGLSLSTLRVNSTKSIYPYAALADAQGQALAIPRDYGNAYIREFMKTAEVDWTYKPLEDLRNNDMGNTTNEYRMGVGLNYSIFKGLSAELKYQYFQNNRKQTYHYNEKTYSTRNLINTYRQKDGKYPIPLGGIVDENQEKTVSHSGRFQLNYSNTWNNMHSLSAMAGSEVREINSGSVSNKFYGYDAEYLSFARVDYLSIFALNPGGSSQIPGSLWSLSGFTDRYLSHFANANYRYNNRYSVSASIRKDASNLFGVKSNQRWVPLWSVGTAWDINKEDFYAVEWLPRLKLRATYGYNGNVNKSVSGLPTAQYRTDALTGLNYATIQNPPNPDLRWEKVGVLNLAADFGFKNKRISGSIEYYIKNSSDLIGDVMLDPTTGFHRTRRYNYKVNYANISTKGLELILSTVNLQKRIRWKSDLQFSYITDRVTKFNYEDSGLTTYLSAYGAKPVFGKSLFGVYSYPWAGLDESGDPIVVIEGQNSKDYAAYIRNMTFDQLVYHGSAIPVYSASLMNTFTCKGLSLSFNFLYKGGYYFQRSSINYGNLFNYWQGHTDYEDRWQKPGDEHHTNVPAFPLVNNANREMVYLRSSALIEKGDHIRLRDIRISYSLSIPKVAEVLELYVYAKDLGIVWRANDRKLDPDFPNLKILQSQSLSVGLNITF